MLRAIPSVSYYVWLRRILDTHLSQSWNDKATDVEEREAEELYDLWPEIEDHQRKRLAGLSADLNTLRDHETWVESDWPVMSKGELAQAQSEAFQQKQWDKFLEYLRRPPRFAAQAMVDYLRGRAWQEMGHPEVAVLFFDNAARLEPENATYKALALENLKAMEDWPELSKRSEAYLLDPASPPRLLFRVGDAFRLYGNHTGDRRHYEQGIQAVDEGFRRLPEAGSDELPSVLAGAYATKSLCLEHLGRIQEGLQILEEASTQFPENADLLTAHGLLKRELGMSDSIADFRQAVQRGSVVVLPYIELWGVALFNQDNQEASELCRRGLAVAKQASVAAMLFELLAIALLRQNDSVAARRAFDTAITLDPLSEEIRTNRDRFGIYVADPRTGEPQWIIETKIPGSAIEEVYARLQPAA